MGKHIVLPLDGPNLGHKDGHTDRVKNQNRFCLVRMNGEKGENRRKGGKRRVSSERSPLIVRATQEPTLVNWRTWRNGKTDPVMKS